MEHVPETVNILGYLDGSNTVHYTREGADEYIKTRTDRRVACVIMEYQKGDGI